MGLLLWRVYLLLMVLRACEVIAEAVKLVMSAEEGSPTVDKSQEEAGTSMLA